MSRFLIEDCYIRYNGEYLPKLQNFPEGAARISGCYIKLDESLPIGTAVIEPRKAQKPLTINLKVKNE